MSKFETGKTYEGRSVCDHDCIFSIKVVRRTAKTLCVFIKGQAGAKTLRIGEHNGVEFVKPFGSYSMAPIIKAA
jgi:hypothetical protein